MDGGDTGGVDRHCADPRCDPGERGVGPMGRGGRMSTEGTRVTLLEGNLTGIVRARYLSGTDQRHPAKPVFALVSNGLCVNRPEREGREGVRRTTGESLTGRPRGPCTLPGLKHSYSDGSQ